jgi:hypothetical protein
MIEKGLFQHSLTGHLNSKNGNIINHIESLNDTQLVSNLAETLFNFHKAGNLNIDDKKEIYITESEVNVMPPKERVDLIRSGKTYRGVQYTLHIPIKGEASLLEYYPSNTPTNRPTGAIVHYNTGAELQFSYSSFDTPTSEIQTMFDNYVNNIRIFLDNINSDCETFNKNFPNFINEKIQSRSAVLKKRAEDAKQFKFKVKKQ